jgi:hypothetical protein
MFIPAVAIVTALAARSPVSICEITSTRRLVAQNGSCPSGSSPWRGAGVNIFDAFWDASSGQAMGKGGSFNESVVALTSAKASGIRYFRFFASDWGPNKLYWATHQPQYWAEFDRLWAVIDHLGLSAIPSLGTDDWHTVANALTPGLAEDANAPVVNRSSVSRGLALEYFTQFVTRCEPPLPRAQSQKHLHPPSQNQLELPP